MEKESVVSAITMQGFLRLVFKDCISLTPLRYVSLLSFSSGCAVTRT